LYCRLAIDCWWWDTEASAHRSVEQDTRVHQCQSIRWLLKTTQVWYHYTLPIGTIDWWRFGKMYLLKFPGHFRGKSLYHVFLLLLLLTFNVMRTQSKKDHTLFTALRQCYTVSSCQTPPLISIMSTSSLTKPSLLVSTF